MSKNHKTETDTGGQTSDVQNPPDQSVEKAFALANKLYCQFESLDFSNFDDRRGSVSWFRRMRNKEREETHGKIKQLREAVRLADKENNPRKVRASLVMFLHIVKEQVFIRRAPIKSDIQATIDRIVPPTKALYEKVTEFADKIAETLVEDARTKKRGRPRTLILNRDLIEAFADILTTMPTCADCVNFDPLDRLINATDALIPARHPLKAEMAELLGEFAEAVANPLRNLIDEMIIPQRQPLCETEGKRPTHFVDMTCHTAGYGDIIGIRGYVPLTGHKEPSEPEVGRKPWPNRRDRNPNNPDK